jgi:AcrR family transcriptional regulator
LEVNESKNAIRSDRTQTVLIEAARDLFATDGYAATSTPCIVQTANVSRGALYHHFVDKADLFRAVVSHEQASVAIEIESASNTTADPVAAIRLGGEAFLNAMRDPGRRRILLIDGPAVLGADEMRAIDTDHAGQTLVDGVRAATAAGRIRTRSAEALADLLNATFDRVALVVGDDTAHRVALWELLDALTIGDRQDKSA